MGPSTTDTSVLRKFNALLKKKYLTLFYTVNVKTKIIYEANKRNVTSVVNDKANLLEIFGKDMVDEINNERAAQ